MPETNLYNIDRATGGISDDAFIGIPHSMQAIEKCEIRKYPKSIRLQYALTDDISLTMWGYVHCGLAVSDGKTLMFTNNGEIYINIAWTRTLAYTHAANAPILGCAEYNGYVYYATATKLHRVLLATLAATFTPTDIDRATFTAGNTTNHPMVSTNLYLYIWDGKYVASVQDTVFDADTLVLPADESVYQLTANGASLRVYTRRGSNDDWTCYYWDWVSSITEQTQELTGKMQNVGTKDWVDYAILWVDPILYYYPYQRQQLKRLTNFTHYPNSSCMYKNYFLFGVTWGVYSRGNHTKDYAECLNIEYRTTNSASDEVTCIVNNNWTLYVAWKNWTTYWIDKLSSTTYATTGFFTTRAFYGKNIREDKDGIDMFVVHKALATGESIQIYSQTNLTWGYTLRHTISWPTTDLVSNFKLNLRFNICELKFVLNWVSPYTSTPEIFGISFKLEEGKW